MATADWLASVSSSSAVRAAKAPVTRRRTSSAPMISCSQRSGTTSIDRQPARASRSMCGSRGSSARSGALWGSPLAAARPTNVSSRWMRVARRAATSSGSVPKQVRTWNSRVAWSNSKIEPPSVPESCTARATIVVSTSSRSRLEDTAWLISPSARSSSTDRVMSWKSCTLRIAIAACAANVVRSSTVRSPNGSTSMRQSVRTPATRSAASIGTPRIVRNPASSRPVCQR